MEIGGKLFSLVGGVHEIPVARVCGTLILCGLDAVAPNPEAFLDAVECDFIVCLQTEVEIIRRYPAYWEWLHGSGATRSMSFPTEDHLVADDHAVVRLVTDIYGQLRKGVRLGVHCGAGWGRAGVIALLVMCAAGAEVDNGIRDLRLARPAAGPQSLDQELQVKRLASKVRKAVNSL